MNNRKTLAVALLCAGLVAFALAGCNKTDDKTAEKNQTDGATEKTVLTEKEYEDVMGKYYDELMVASSDASKSMDSVMATEDEKVKIERLKEAMGKVEKIIPMYTQFTVITPPTKYEEAQKLISSGATASGEVLRLTVKMSEVAADEEKIAEVRMLQKQMEEQTATALDFSKGLKIVLGDKVGTGEAAEQK